MTFEKLQSTAPDFTHIIHVADIHIRLTKRHQEYREVFQRFYDDVERSPKTSIVCVLGDVCHSKSDLSPECVQMVSEFLSNLANLRETIVVPGNHDCTLFNKTRMDSLSPIVDALSHPKIHYLKETKLYGIGNILFNNMCIFNDPEKYILGKDIPEIYRNQYKHIIALFHGPVDQAVTDSGFSISNPAILPPLFDWHHIALLGDIHRRQNIQESVPEEHKPCIHFPGSLIQQNHGEVLHPHGYTVWDLSDYSYRYKEVDNDYGFFTVDLHGSQILTDLSELPKKTYLRLRYLDSISTEIKSAEAEISKLTEIFEASRFRVESEAYKKAKETRVCNNVKLSEISDMDYQATLITDFLKTKLNLLDQEKIDKILLVNRNVNSEIKKDEFPRNLKWTPIRFEWDNMFSYGEGNHIDFTQMKGVYGIFGPNTCGKSSVFSAFCFCLFDKWERGFKAIVAKNVEKDSFRCKFEFTIGGIHYFIEKTGEATRSGNIRVEVKFWRVVNGMEEDLTDVMRKKTNDVIRDYVGTFEDFVLTTLSIQNASKNNINFIDMGNTERKDLLVQFLGLMVFDRLYESAYAKGKELAAKLKRHKDKNYMQELVSAEEKLLSVESSIKECQTNIEELSKQIKQVNENIVIETGKIIVLDKDVPMSLSVLSENRTRLQFMLTRDVAKNKTLHEELVKKKEILDNINKTLSEISVEDLVKIYQKHNETKKRLEISVQRSNLKRVDLNNKRDKLKKLSEYKYNPNCEYCVQNVFVVDAKNTEKSIQQDQIEMDMLVEETTKLHKEFEEWKWVDEVYQNYTRLLNEQSKAKDEYSAINTKILLLEKDIEKTSQAWEENEKRFDLYYKNQISVENNQKVSMMILTYKNALNKLEINLNIQNKKLLELTGAREVLKRQIQQLKETIADIQCTEKEQEIYDYYCQAVGRNGIPYHVICHAIPEITREVNSILTQITDFTIEIESDDKNIMPYVNYESKGRWPIEMTSGFERFVTSVAIRVALSNISNLPRTTFLVLDEGFGNIDGHNIPSMYILFTYLKSYFEFIIVISHLDSLRDMVDKQIEISQIGNFSKIVYE